MGLGECFSLLAAAAALEVGGVGSAPAPAAWLLWLLLTGGAPAVAAELSPIEGSGPESACSIQGCVFMSTSLMRALGSGTSVLLSRSLAVFGVW